jgi:alpha-galactosidase
MQNALEKANRDIVYSLCQYGMGDVWEWGAEVGGNCWRTTGDITDDWSSVESIGFGQAGHEAFAGPGHWNDPDMLVVGKVGWGPKLHSTRLSPNEQYTHISLWALLAAPLLIGCDMTQLDEFTYSLLSNDEVLDVNQDILGKQASRIVQYDGLEIWSKELEDGSKAVGLFNRGLFPASLTVTWKELGISGIYTVRNLWSQTDEGNFDQKFTSTIPTHGVKLIRVYK